MDADVLPPKLLTVLHTAAEKVRGHDFIHVFSHYDADGVAAASVLAVMLERLGKEYQVSTLPVLNDTTFEAVESSSADCILMSDMGASYIPRLEGLGRDVVVLDHHRTDYDSDRIVYANPHLYGIDGMTSACGSTMALLLAVTVDDRNWDLSQIAMAGIAGDRQHLNGMSGLNIPVLEEASRRGFVRKTAGSLIPAGPLAKSLYLSTDPFIEGVTGDQAAVSALLQDAGVDGGRLSSELDDDERRRLSSLIAARLALQGVSVTTLKEVCRDRYMLKDHRTDAESLADILNSCGREGLGGVAVGYFLGDRDCLLQAAEVNDASRRRIAEAVSSLSSVGLTQMENIQYFDSSLMGSTGIICGIAMQYLGDPMKPTVGLNTQNDGRTNVSTRGMWCQLDRGVDLSVAVRQAAEAAGGSGGGHRIAAGATFPNGRESDFLSELDRIVGSQIAAR